MHVFSAFERCIRISDSSQYDNIAAHAAMTSEDVEASGDHLKLETSSSASLDDATDLQEHM
jgi:hypothetical protein